MMKRARMIGTLTWIGLVAAALMSGGCGRAYTVTMKAPEDIERYNAIHVENPDVASAEHTEDALQANGRYAAFMKEQLIQAVQEKMRFELCDHLDGDTETLSLEATMRIVYGSQAARYIVGFGAGSGSIDITVRLEDPLSHEIKAGMHSNSRLSIGVFGGDMDAVIEKSIKRIVDDFFAQL